MQHRQHQQLQAGAGRKKPAPRPFDNLCPQLIERCLLPLNFKDRVRCMLVSKRFCEIGRTGTLIWESIACTPTSTQGMNQVLRWVLAHQDQVRRLSLQPSEDIPIPQLSLWGMMTSVFVIVSKTLVSLDFSLISPVELSGWVAPLTSLRWLSVAAPHIVVSGVGELKLLRTLQLSTPHAEDATETTIVFKDHSIPAGLGALVLEDMILRELPPCITRASASLTRLRLDINYSEEFAEEGAEAGSTSGLVLLTRLTALQVLEMQHCDSTVIPREISALGRLTHLCLSWSFSTNPPPDLSALSGLAWLAVLNMQYCQLTAMEPVLHGMVSLHTLCLGGNPAVQLSPDSAWLTRLVQLDLDLEAAVRNSGIILGMVSLEQVCINGFDSRFHKPLPTAAIVLLIQALCALPALRVLLFKNQGQQLLTQTVETLAAFVSFLRSRPGVELRSCPRSVGNPFDGGWLTWDKAFMFTDQLLALAQDHI